MGNSIINTGIFELNPVGSIQMYGGAIAPTGYLLCDGTSYATATYPNLFAVLGYTWGGAGATFNVPDIQGASPAGVGTSTGYVENETVVLGTKYDDQMQGHLHAPDPVNQGVIGGTTAAPGGPWGGLVPVQVGSPTTDGVNGIPRTGNVTKGKTVGVNFIIKY